MCTSALCLPVYQVSPSVLPLLPTPAHERAVEQHMCKSCSVCDCIAYCKNIQIKAMEMWLNDWTEQCSEHWKFDRPEVFLYKKNNSSIGEPWEKTCASIDRIMLLETQTLRLAGSKTVRLQKLCCAWRPWGCQMLTWMEASFTYYGHRVWFRLFGVILWCYVTVCVLAWQSYEEISCVEIHAILTKSATTFWKLPPSNQFKIVWNKSLLVCLHSTPTLQLETILYHILREKAWLTLCTEAKAILWHIVFL